MVKKIAKDVVPSAIEGLITRCMDCPMRENTWCWAMDWWVFPLSEDMPAWCELPGNKKYGRE